MSLHVCTKLLAEKVREREKWEHIFNIIVFLAFTCIHTCIISTVYSKKPLLEILDDPKPHLRRHARVVRKKKGKRERNNDKALQLEKGFKPALGIKVVSPIIEFLPFLVPSIPTFTPSPPSFPFSPYIPFHFIFHPTRY